ncbi:MAG TPA: ABC transporter ATP-binding protein [Acidobacteriota bacterium]
MSEPEAMLVFEELTRRYGERVAVDRLSLTVRRGEMFGLIGPDGAGKTTTLRVALGLLEPHGGKVRTCGLTPDRQRRELAGKVGYLSQRFSLYGDLSVDENIGFFADVHGVRGWKARREELLEMVRMRPFRQRLAERLSGGMKQKLALACTLIHTPELLILDEPTTGVDPVSRRDFWKLLARLQREGLTIVMTTPYLDEAERCQRVALIDHGRLLAADSPDRLREGWPGALVELLVRPRRLALERLREREEVREIESFGERLHLTLGGLGREDAETATSRLRAELEQQGVTVDAARVVQPSLEDVFIARIRSAESGTVAQQEVNR